MAITTTSISAIVTAVTAASDETEKCTALITPLVNAVVKEITANGVLTPGQQVRVAALTAELTANNDSFATAITVA